MNRIKSYCWIILIIVFAAFSIFSCRDKKNERLIKILILSGKNNHEWQKTTPVLSKTFEDSKLFRINITERPDTLTYKTLKDFDVVVSNWNTWPDNNIRLSNEWENDFLKYVRKGGGVVSVHAGASSFYNWKEYHEIGIGRWGKETSHGLQKKAKVFQFDQANPITKGLKDFYITDEIWEKTDIYSGAKAIGYVLATDEKDGHVIKEPVLFVNKVGKGRCFFITLGHNERALLNSGFQTLLLRATQWTANRKISIEPPVDLRERTEPESNNFSWEQSDTTFGLMKNEEIIWQYNFNNRFGKSYFHPVTVKNSTLTCFSPPDHPWHLGLWFSWKFINGINYWEYLNDFKSEKTGYKSDGITELKKIDIIKNSDFSAGIKMKLSYHPTGEAPIMTEKRDIQVSHLFNDGSYFIDHENSFSTVNDDVVLDRTPIEGEPEGQSWGGYAGLSVRFNQDYTSPEIIVPTDSLTYRKNRWLYMGLNTLTGEKAGICIFQNQKFTTTTTSWYVINNPEIPFFYYSPAALFDGKIILKKGETLKLKYRIWIIPGKINKEEIESKYTEYVKNQSPDSIKN
jgi:type 1 glutamine amidotransferase